MKNILKHISQAMKPQPATPPRKSKQLLELEAVNENLVILQQLLVAKNESSITFSFPTSQDDSNFEPFEAFTNEVQE